MVENKVYSVQEIKEIIYNILKKYGINEAYLFGSYARNEATCESDIDIMITGGKEIHSLLKLTALELELKNSLKKNIDLLTEESCMEKKDNEYFELANKLFLENILKERVKIYE